jgi:hypothetical protein
VVTKPTSKRIELRLARADQNYRGGSTLDAAARPV